MENITRNSFRWALAITTLACALILAGIGPAQAQVPIGADGSYTGLLPNTHTETAGLLQLPTQVLLEFSLPAFPDDGLSADYVNGRALAFDGVSLPSQIWANYAAGGWNPETNIYRLSIAGVRDTILNLGLPVGSLAHNPVTGELYGGSYPILSPFTPQGIPGEVIALDLSTSAISSLFVFNFPAFDTCVPQLPGFISGLAYDPAPANSLWLADDTGKTVYNVDLAGMELSSFQVDPAGGHCNTGLAVAGDDLWLSDLQGDGAGGGIGQILQVSKLGVGLAYFSTTIPSSQPNTSDDIYLPYDLEFDDKTFAPKCALWSNEATFGQPRIRAWEIPCPENGGGGEGDPPPPTPDETEVQIDIKPGSFDNAINLSAAGSLPMAILSSSTFDATTVDSETIKLAGAGVRVVGKGNKLLCNYVDVNNDGLIDIKCNIENQAMSLIEPGDSEAHMQAWTFPDASGKKTKIKGHDRIKIVNQ